MASVSNSNQSSAFLSTTPSHNIAGIVPKGSPIQSGNVQNLFMPGALDQSVQIDDQSVGDRRIATAEYSIPEGMKAQISFFFSKLGNQVRTDLKNWMPSFVFSGAIAGSVIGFTVGLAATAAFSYGVVFTNPATLTVALVAAFVSAMAGFITGVVVGTLVCITVTLIDSLVETVKYFLHSEDERICSIIDKACNEARDIIRKNFLSSEPMSVEDKWKLDHLIYFIGEHCGLTFDDERLRPEILDGRNIAEHLSDEVSTSLGFRMGQGVVYADNAYRQQEYQSEAIERAPAEQLSFHSPPRLSNGMSMVPLETQSLPEMLDTDIASKTEL